MGLLDNYTGIGMSPRPKWQHQMVIRRAQNRTADELDEQGLLMLSEATVTNDWDDLAPDLVIFDDAFHPMSMIEITTHKELRQILRKFDELIDRFPDAECFTYDYEKNVLYKYDIETDSWISSLQTELHSDYLELPVMEYLM